MIGHELHFRQKVTRDEYGASLRGVVAQELTEPLDGLGVQAIGGLVKHERLGLCQDGARETESLRHTE